MRDIMMTVFVKDGNKWDISNTCTDKVEIYKSLANDLLKKKIQKCDWIKSIKDTCNYDGTRTITTYYTNNVKRVYVVEDH